MLSYGNVSLNVKFMAILLLVSIIPTLLVSVSSLGGYNQMQGEFITELEGFRTNYTLTADKAEQRAIAGAKKSVLTAGQQRLMQEGEERADTYADTFLLLENTAEAASVYIGSSWMSFEGDAASFDGVIRGDVSADTQRRLAHAGAYLDTLERGRYTATGILVLDDGGMVASEQLQLGTNLQQSQWYLQAAAAGEIQVVGPVMMAGERSLVVAAPVDRNGSLLGVIGLRVPVASLAAEGNANMSAALVDGQGDVIHATGDLARFTGTSLLEADNTGISQLGGRLSVGESGSMNVSYDGTQYVAYRPVTGTRFRSVVMRSQDDMLAAASAIGNNISASYVFLDTRTTTRITELRTSLRSSLLGIVYKYALVLVFVVLAVAAAGFYFARAVTQPVRRLKEKADLVSRGAVEEDIQIDTGDELEELATAFNRVIHTVKILQGRDAPASHGGTEDMDVEDEGDGSEEADDGQ